MDMPWVTLGTVMNLHRMPSDAVMAPPAGVEDSAI
jgi:hypothetical protein